MSPRRRPENPQARSPSRRQLTAGLWCLLLVGCGSEPPPPPAASQPVSVADLERTAETGPVKLTARIDRGELTLPGALRLSVIVECEAGVEVTLPEIGETLGDFAVSASKDIPETGDALRRMFGREYTLEGAIPGPAAIPPLEVTFSDRREKADGSLEPYEDKVATEALTVQVRQQLADLKGPVSLPWSRSYVILAWLVAIVAALVLVAWLGRRWYRRRGGPEAPREALVPAHEWALAELDMLDAEGLLERGRVQEFYYRINAIVRGYIERRFGLMAAEQTSEEFVRAMGRSQLLQETHKEVLRRFVDACDPVKYARQQPVAGEVEWVQMTARDFVLQSAPAQGPVDARPEPRLEEAAA